MSFDYQPIADEASALLAEFGIDMVLVSANAGDGYDPVTGMISGGGDPTRVTFKGIKIAPTVEYSQSIGEQNVQARDMLIYMEPGKAFPTLTDRVEIEDDEVIETWEVVNFQEIKPADVAVLYILQVRP